MNQKPITLLVCALGGEGGGVLTEWLVETARHAGYPAQATSIPGVAQRTGATTYYLEVFPVAMKDLGGKRPVFSLNPVPGALDAMISSELLETARQVGNGMASPDRTLVITSSSRTLTTQERMQMGDGRADPADMLKLVQQFSRAHQVFDMAGVAKQAGTVVSAVMLGAIAGSGLFPFRREDYEAVVKAGGRGAEASLRGFAQAFELVARGRQQDDYLAQVLAPQPPKAAAQPALAAPAQQFPSPPYTTLATTPASREKPYLYVDSSGKYHVWVPALRTNASGASWASGSTTPGSSIPMSQFYVTRPGDTAATMNAALAAGLNLFLTPGVYSLEAPLNVTRANTVILGLGFPTLQPTAGNDAMDVADVDGVKIAGILFDAGTTNSAALSESDPWMPMIPPIMPTVIPLKVRRPLAAMENTPMTRPRKS